jgi:hypothetical protein
LIRELSARSGGVIAAFIRRSTRPPNDPDRPRSHSRGEYRRGIEQASAHGHCAGEAANDYARAIGLRLCADICWPNLSVKAAVPAAFTPLPDRRDFMRRRLGEAHIAIT